MGGRKRTRKRKRTRSQSEALQVGNADERDTVQILGPSVARLVELKSFVDLKVVLKNARDNHIEGRGGCKALTKDEIPAARSSLI